MTDDELDLPIDIYLPPRGGHQHTDACVNRVHGPDGQWPYEAAPFHELAMDGHIEVEREVPVIWRTIPVALTRECKAYIDAGHDPLLSDDIWKRFVEKTEVATVTVASFGDLDAYPSFGLAMTDAILPGLLAEAREEVVSEGEGG